MEIEAAYAYDFGVASLKLTSCKLNNIEACSVGSPERIDTIHKEVIGRISLALTGQKMREHTSSRYRGPYFDKKRSRWTATITMDGRSMFLGCYDSELEAAVAYNIAVTFKVGSRFKPNPIHPEEMPAPDAVETIRIQVLSRLARRGFVVPTV